MISLQTIVLHSMNACLIFSFDLRAWLLLLIWYLNSAKRFNNYLNNGFMLIQTHRLSMRVRSSLETGLLQ